MLGALSTEITREIDGGYIGITPMQLLIAWFLYRNGEITYFELRVYFALWELAHRHSCDQRDRPSLAKLQDELGQMSARGLRPAIAKLLAVGLLTRCSNDGIEFARSPDQIRAENLSDLWAAIHRYPRPGRVIPVPRRILTHIFRRSPDTSRGAPETITATILAQLIWCLWRDDKGTLHNRGCCKAEWIASVFGIHQDNVHEARSRLTALGWLQADPTPASVLKSHGLWMTLNLRWQDPSATPQIHSTRLALVVDNSDRPRHELPPQRQELPPQGAAKRQELPVLINKDPLQKKLEPKRQQQEPAASGGRVAAFSSSTGEGTGKSPRWPSIDPDEVRDPTRRGELHRQLVAKGVIPDDEGPFEVACDRAARKNNPGGYLRILLSNHPESLTAEVEKRRARQAAETRRRLDDEAKRQAEATAQAQEAEITREVTAHIDALSPEAREKLQADAFAARPHWHRFYRDRRPSEFVRNQALHEHVREQLFGTEESPRQVVGASRPRADHSKNPPPSATPPRNSGPRRLANVLAVKTTPEKSPRPGSLSEDAKTLHALWCAVRNASSPGLVRDIDQLYPGLHQKFGWSRPRFVQAREELTGQGLVKSPRPGAAERWADRFRLSEDSRRRLLASPELQARFLTEP